MRVSAKIRERLQQNEFQRRDIGRNGFATRLDEIQMEYLSIEAQALDHMLVQLQKRRWTRLRGRKSTYFIAIFAMAAYVIGIFYMFKGMDLTKVEQWQFAVTALPFWLIIVLIPVTLITLLTTRNSH